LFLNNNEDSNPMWSTVMQVLGLWS